MAAIVFDLDGTLIDSAQAICDVGNALLGEMGERPLSVDEARSYVGHGARRFLERAFAARELAFDQATFNAHFARFEMYYARSPASSNVPYPGVVRALAILQRQGHAIGLCTNKPAAPTQVVLDGLALSPFFSVVVAGDTLPETKPHPAPLLYAGAKLASSPLLYVGDSEVDAQTAERANVPFVLFTEGYRKTPVHDLHHAAAFSDFDLLPQIIETLLKQAGLHGH